MGASLTAEQEHRGQGEREAKERTLQGAEALEVTMKVAAGERDTQDCRAEGSRVWRHDVGLLMQERKREWGRDERDERIRAEEVGKRHALGTKAGQGLLWQCSGEIHLLIQGHRN